MKLYRPKFLFNVNKKKQKKKNNIFWVYWNWHDMRYFGIVLRFFFDFDVSINMPTSSQVGSATNSAKPLTLMKWVTKIWVIFDILITISRLKKSFNSKSFHYYFEFSIFLNQVAKKRSIRPGTSNDVFFTIILAPDVH